MKKIVSGSIEEQAKTAAEIIASYVKKKPNALLCLAAGDTPTETYAWMARMQREGLVDFRDCRLIGLDEWAGLDENTEGGCIKYIIDHVVKPLGLRKENVVFFDACSEDLEEECARVNKYLAAEGPIDVSLMGVGMNGHIALNEPGCDFNSTAHTVLLDPITVKVAQKYFQKPTPVTQGITLGMKQIWDSRVLVVIANGEKKQAIMHTSMYGEVTNAVPASALQNHPNCIVSLDTAADSAADWDLDSAIGDKGE